MAKFVSFASNKLRLLSTIASSTGASDTDKIIATNAVGKIDQTFLSVDVATNNNAIAYAIALGGV